jgi:hypothetical protein
MKTVTESAPCSPVPDEGDYRVAHFTVTDVHLNILDGV